MNIVNKTVLITGANRGIGRALLEEALRRGARKVYAGTRGVLQHSDKRVTPLTLDVTSASQIEQAVKEVYTLDVLINNAGIAIYDDLGNLEVLEQTLAVNLLGLLRVTNAFLPLLKRSKGAILNNLSLAGLAPLPIIPSYSTSKAAALNLTQSLRALLADQGITVHAVVIGPVDTDMPTASRFRRRRPKQRQPASSMVLKRVKRRSFPTRFRNRSRKGGVMAYRRHLSASSRHSCRRRRREPNDVGTETTQSIEDSLQS